MSFEHNLSKIIQKHQDLADKMASGIAGEEFVRISKEYAELEQIVQKINQFNDLKQEIQDLDEILANKEVDSEMQEFAQAELKSCKDKYPEIERQVKIALLPKDEADSKNAIIEIRAGTGGDEAALFAATLFRMYQRFAE